MKSIQFTKSLSIACLIALSACQPNKEVVERDKVRISVNDKMNADELTAAAEQLVGPFTFMLAYSTAKMALEKDPTNLKAEFLVRYLKRFEAFRGFHFRTMDVMTPENRLNNQKMIDKASPNSPLKAFFTDSTKPKLKKPSDGQIILNEYYKAVVEFREFLIKNASSDIVLNINPHVFEKSAKEDQQHNCQYKNTPEGGWELDCNVSHILQRRLNSADLIALRQFTSAEIIYSFFNSYSLDGLEKLAEFDKNAEKTNQQRAEFLSNLPNFGKLTTASTIHLLRELGSDYFTAARWVIESQKQLCPKGYHSRDQRKGHLFASGLCIEDQNEVEKGLSLLQRALGGAINLEVEGADDQKYNMKVDVFAWSKNPIQDLRQIAPTTWNQCDQAVAIQDNTLGGMFVDGNYNVLLAQPCNSKQ